MSLALDRALGLVGTVAILVFFYFFWSPAAAGRQPGFDDTILGKIVISFVVLGGVVPWLYLLETSRRKVSKLRLTAYFLGSCIAAPLVLLFGKDRHEGRSAH